MKAANHMGDNGQPSFLKRSEGFLNLRYTGIHMVYSLVGLIITDDIDECLIDPRFPKMFRLLIIHKAAMDR